tara:strand:- start:121 stop:666 length:546 start_codon:yes stop_codon:yes gene_type:complete
MIIPCYNCKKKFEIDSILIPEKGRLLQCNNCNHQWFFKKEIKNKLTTPVKINKSPELTDYAKTNVSLELKRQDKEEENKKPETIEFLDKATKNDLLIEKISIEDKTEIKEDNNSEVDLIKKKNKYNILGIIIVFIISFVALIIVLDTFQNPISKIVPNMEFLLYNLYETINDILLFLNDLI